MANREYEMLFKLGAQLGQNFTGTFSSAQQVLTATQKKIQELNRLQSDIGAYQRQQSGIEKSNQKLELYKSQLANTQRALDTVRKEIEANGTASAELAAKENELANKELALKNRIRDTENAISDKNNRLKQMGEGLSSARVNTDKLSEETQRLGNEMATLRAQEERAANEANNFGNTALQTFDAVGSALVASGIATGLKKIYDSFAECIGVASEFEATMSTVEALSGANAQQMDTLSAKAKELGATTVFTANQSAEAMTYMGMAGWKAEEMLSGMNGVMALASASGEDLGLVSDIVTDNLTAFGLKAKDTAHFADVLAAAATNSNTSVAIMGETFSGSAAIAGALGYSIEDVAVAVGEMANAGVKGSVAGTALKNMFNGLLSGVTLTGKAFGEYEFTAVNVDGTMKGFAETIDELRVYFDQMTESERVNNAMAIAGQRGYNGLLAILNTTEEDYRKLSDTINNCSGAAQRMADIKLDNLSGDVTLLKSAADGLKMSVGELYRDDLRKLAQIATEILGSINEFITENPIVAKAILTIVGGIGAVVGAYTVLNKIKKAKNAIDALSATLRAKNAAATATETAAEGANAVATTGATAAHKALNLAMLANPAVIITASIIALTAALTAWREASKTASIEEQTFSTALEANNGEIERLNESYKTACETYGETSDQARALKYDLDEATASIEAQSFSVSDLFNEIDALHTSTADLLSIYGDTAKELDNERESAHILVAKLKEISSSSETAANKQALIEPIIKRLNAIYPSLGLTVDNVAHKMNGLSDAIDNAANSESLQKKYEAAIESNDKLLIQEQQLAEAIQKAEIVQDKARKKFLSTTSYNGQIADVAAMTGVINGAATSAREEMEKAEEATQKAYEDWRAVKKQIEENNEILKEYGETVSGTGDEATSIFTAMSIAIADVTAETENLITAYYDAYNAAYSSVSGQYAIWDNAASAVPTSIYTINSALSSQIDYWDKYNNNLETLSKRAENIEGLSDVIAGFADGGKESVNAIAGMAKASDAELKKMVESYAKLKEEQDKTAQSLADVKTDFDTKMDEISQKMADTVSGMKLDDESRAAAKSTIEAYAKAILAGKGKAVDAAEEVSKATAAALSSAEFAQKFIDNKNKPVFDPMGKSQNKASYETNSTASNISAGIPSFYDSINEIDVKRKYASGTNYAESGFALVGEEGPEIVYMHGGEKVIDAENTRAIMGGGQNNTITISPQIVINNNGGEIDEAQVSDLSERLISDVMDALEEAGINRRRSAYV